ncbi:MAG: DUF86 domain-containing protein [Chloroflexota bacterium]|nr:DUF86 domain-containing protein [Chloroflexota bacterium]
MSVDPRLNLNDILDRIDRIERYTSRGRETFMQSELHQDAVIRSFEVIGEAVKRLDKTITAQQPQVPWRDFASFRDVLIHQYERVVLESVWLFAQEDLPALKSGVLTLLSALEDRHSGS